MSLVNCLTPYLVEGRMIDLSKTMESQKGSEQEKNMLEMPDPSLDKANKITKQTDAPD